MASADRRDIPDEGTDLSAVKDAAYSLGETLEEVVTEHPLTALGLALAARLDVAPPITIRTRRAAPARRRAGLVPSKATVETRWTISPPPAGIDLGSLVSLDYFDRVRRQGIGRQHATEVRMTTR